MGEVQLPAGLDLLWGRRGAGKRGPRPGLSADAIVDAAIRLADADKLRAIGLISSYTLSEARMANDERRAEKEQGAPAWTYDALLRELADEATYPRLYKIAWTPPPGSGEGGPGAPGAPPSEREEYLFGLDRILDGIQVYMDRM